MRATVKHLHYSVKGGARAKIKQKLLHKVAEESNLHMGEMIYLDIRLQKEPSYGGSNHWILIQDLEKKRKLSFFKKAKEYLA